MKTTASTEFAYRDGWSRIAGAIAGVIASASVSLVLLFAVAPDLRAANSQQLMLVNLLVIAIVSFGAFCSVICGWYLLRSINERLWFEGGTLIHRTKIGTIRNIDLANVEQVVFMDNQFSRLRRINIIGPFDRITIYATMPDFDNFWERLKERVDAKKILVED